tara:strand:+ start:4403 stop:4714 length:312 start_codon:yes stop_codon:yes gene_type:complete
METVVIESEVESHNEKITVEALSIIIENIPAIKNIKKKLETIKNEQPNLYKLWKLNIYQNEVKLIKSLLDCDVMLEKVDTLTTTLSLADIQTFVVLNKCGYTL